ncbi:MAG: restriction endonuclease [Deltaproteobacteria bacterium]|jgi:hypothetical protein
MSLAGETDLTRFTYSLDPSKLVRLTADLLWISGHRRVTITDGPGDGGRDVHASAPDGRDVVAQCKHHRKASATCSSAELGELPLALLKMGYARGLFVTNAKVSPQAKREYINDYPDFELRFIDGDQLARQVLQNPLLRSVWFDGVSVDRVGNALNLPILVREHTSDLPIVPYMLRSKLSLDSVIADIKAVFPSLSVVFSPGALATTRFEPYRYPEPLAAEEGEGPEIFGTELSLLGDVDLFELPTLMACVARSVAEWVASEYPRITVRVGRPIISSLEGERAGAMTQIDQAPVSFVKSTNAPAVDEAEFFIELPGDWTFTCDARVSEGGAIRLFEPSLDVLASYQIVGRPSLTLQAQLRSEAEATALGWNRSLFALVKEDPEHWHFSDVPAPDRSWPWTFESAYLCAWFDGSLLADGRIPRSFRVNPMEELIPDTGKVLARVHEALQALEDVRVVDPTQARHMVGLVSHDVFPSVDAITHSTAEIMHFPDTLPSPIRPSSREIQILAAWTCDEEVMSDELDAESAMVLNVAPAIETHAGFIVFTWDLPATSLETLSTADIFSQVSQEIAETTRLIEDRLSSQGLVVSRSTQKYWSETHGVSLGVAPNESAKAFLWGVDSEGKWRAKVTGSQYDLSEDDSELPEGMSAAMSEYIRKQTLE